MNKQTKTQHQQQAAHIQAKAVNKQEVPRLETAVINAIPSLQRDYTDPQILSPTDAHLLQRAIGNQALGRLIIQRKMTVGPVGDKYEQEADTVAKQVVRKLHTSLTQTTPVQTAQRQEEEELQMQPVTPISALQRQEEEEEVQAKHDPMLAGGEVEGDIETAVSNAKSGGSPISDNIRHPMEQAFNTNFSQVKIHTGGQADTLNRSLSARAFTTGNDIFFRNGEYSPNNSSGNELLAHELTHVIQQTGATPQSSNNANSRKPYPVSTINRKPTHLQRYHLVSPEDYSLGEQTKFSTQNLEKTEFSSEYTSESRTVSNLDEAPDVPSLNVSDDGKMAIEATEAQPKIFYAHEGLIEASNQKLKQINADIRLKGGGASMKVPQTPEAPDPLKTRNLTMVQPAKEVPDEEDVRLEVINALDQHECIYVVNSIIGASTHGARAAVFSNTTEQETSAPSSSEPVHSVGKFISQGNKSKSSLVKNLKNNTDRVKVKYNDKQDVESDYNTMNPETKDTASKKLGINEYASPEVGEAFVVNSLNKEMGTSATTDTFDFTATNQPEEEDSDEYLQALQTLDSLENNIDIMKANVSTKIKALKGVWGNHYAGVVAKSENDAVTLENYNRDQEYKWEIDRLFNNLYKKFVDFRQVARQDVGSMKVSDRKKRLDLMQEFETKSEQYNVDISEDLENAIEQVTTSITVGLRNTDIKEMIYFAMYGQKPGQSFHEQFKGMTANSMTFRIRESAELYKAPKIQKITERKNEMLTALGKANAPDQEISRSIGDMRQQATTKMNDFISQLQSATDVESAKNVVAQAQQYIGQFKSETLARIVTPAEIIKGEILDYDFNNPDYEEISVTLHVWHHAMLGNSKEVRKKKRSLQRAQEVVTNLKDLSTMV